MIFKIDLFLFICETAEEMDQADDELRETIRHIWPLQAKKILDLLIPQNDTLNQGKLTVGKIYAGLLILESWRNTRFGQIDSGLPVCVKFANFACKTIYTIIQIILNLREYHQSTLFQKKIISILSIFIQFQ